jgi:hypothetical protein
VDWAWQEYPFAGRLYMWCHALLPLPVWPWRAASMALASWGHPCSHGSLPALLGGASKHKHRMRVHASAAPNSLSVLGTTVQPGPPTPSRTPHLPPPCQRAPAECAPPWVLRGLAHMLKWCCIGAWLGMMHAHAALAGARHVVPRFPFGKCLCSWRPAADRCHTCVKLAHAM